MTTVFRDRGPVPTLVSPSAAPDELGPCRHRIFDGPATQACGAASPEIVPRKARASVHDTETEGIVDRCLVAHHVLGIRLEFSRVARARCMDSIAHLELLLFATPVVVSAHYSPACELVALALRSVPCLGGVRTDRPFETPKSSWRLSRWQSQGGSARLKAIAWPHTGLRFSPASAVALSRHAADLFPVGLALLGRRQTTPGTAGAYQRQMADRNHGRSRTCAPTANCAAISCEELAGLT